MTPAPTRPFHLLVYSDAAQRGGAEVTLAALMSRLPHEITVSVLGVDTEVVRWLVEHRPGTRGEVIAPITDRTDVTGMRAHRTAFRRIGADIIQFNLSTLWSCQWPMAAALTIRGQRVLAVENSPMGSPSAMSNRLKRWTSARLEAHVAVGERTAREIESSAGLPRGSVEHLYHGVEVIEHQPPERHVHGPLIGTIARHDPVKGLDVLLHAVALLDPSVHLVLIGGGPEHDRLVALAAELGLASRVEFREVPWSERAGDHLAGFDLFVLPSRLEGFPVTIMEAMLAGVPVVATDVGSVRESVDDGVTGRVVPPEDPVALAEAITDVLADDAARAAMGERGREVATERFTLEATTASYCALYERILSGAGSRVLRGSRR